MKGWVLLIYERYEFIKEEFNMPDVMWLIVHFFEAKPDISDDIEPGIFWVINTVQLLF